MTQKENGMSIKKCSNLPDPVYGSLDTHTCHPAQVSAGSSDDGKLIHVYIGPFNISMSERNWRAVFSTITRVEVPIPTRRIVLDDENGTAKVVSE
jgi:hypothetical protein